MPLTGAVLHTALASIGAVGKQLAGLDDLAAGADGALRRAPGLTVAGAAAFLATCAQESAYFRTTTEYGSGQRYAPYIGRTFTQITWAENYRDFGRWCHARGLVADPETFVRNPRSLGELRWAWLGPIQYWEENGIWRWANAGNFRAVSQAINGGNGRVGTSFTPHGWKERQAMYAAFLRAGATLLPTGAPGPTPTEGELVATEHEIRRIADETAATMIRYLLPNVYTARDDDRMNVGDTLAWGTAHAARALDASNAVLAKLGAIEAALSRVASAQPGLDTEAIRAVVREAIAESVQVTGDLTVTPR